MNSWIINIYKNKTCRLAQLSQILHSEVETLQAMPQLVQKQHPDLLGDVQTF